MPGQPCPYGSKCYRKSVVTRKQVFVWSCFVLPGQLSVCLQEFDEHYVSYYYQRQAYTPEDLNENGRKKPKTAETGRQQHKTLATGRQQDKTLATGRKSGSGGRRESTILCSIPGCDNNVRPSRLERGYTTCGRGKSGTHPCAHRK